MKNLFELFWKEYPKKVGKKQCKAYWSKLNPNIILFDEIMEGLNKQNVASAKHALHSAWYPHPPDPIRWLNYERWEYEIPSIDNDDELTHFYKPPKYKDYDER